MKKVAVIIPFYKSDISDYENISLQQCKKILSDHDIIIIKPENFALPQIAKDLPVSKTVSFRPVFFESISGYNQLMLSAEFYKVFLDYEYILIYQMDCFIFKDELNYWCDQDLDYIGAPWIKKKYHKNAISLFFSKLIYQYGARFKKFDQNEPNQYQLENRVGNGGFSLRRVSKFYDLSLLMQPIISHYLNSKGNLYNEDVFWSIEVNREKRILNIPNAATALRFAFEVPPVKQEFLNEDLIPFGCHDWDHYADYWRNIFGKLGYKI